MTDVEVAAAAARAAAAVLLRLRAGLALAGRALAGRALGDAGDAAAHQATRSANMPWYEGTALRTTSSTCTWPATATWSTPDSRCST